MSGLTYRASNETRYGTLIGTCYLNMGSGKNTHSAPNETTLDYSLTINHSTEAWKHVQGSLRPGMLGKAGLLACATGSAETEMTVKIETRRAFLNIIGRLLGTAGYKIKGF